MTVWRQAEKYRVPRIAFINKLDKASASIEATLVSMERRLGVRPLVIQQAIGGRPCTLYSLYTLHSIPQARRAVTSLV